MTDAARPVGRALAPLPDRRIVITALGIGQILAWGSSYYLPAVLAQPIAADTGWPIAGIVGGLSLGLLVAGVVLPRIGSVIQRRGGRPVLAGSALLLAAGLAGLALAPSLPAYLAAWVVMGLGMGAGLYDAAFGALGRIYGRGARSAITTLTLFGGFASTACWPLSALLVGELGWRGACLAYAGIHVALVLPLYLSALPATVGDAPSAAPGPADARPPAARPPLLLGLLAGSLTLASGVSAVISVHLLTLLQARDLTLAAAVALGAMVGPSQVGARAIEMAVGRFHHPIWTKVASTTLVLLGLSALASGLPVLVPALILYGAGIGLESIARGTLPLALFGPAGYAALMGRLAMPSLIVQAAAPSIGSLLLGWTGAAGALDWICVAALANLALALTLLAVVRRPITGGTSC